MTTQSNNGRRLLGRELARPLTAEEEKTVGGGEPLLIGTCTTCGCSDNPDCD